jgi:hypothetical protein
MNSIDPVQPGLERLQQGSLLTGGLALALCGMGAYFDPGVYFRSYLVAYLFWVGLSLGCMAVVMLHHLTGGAWGFVIRRPLESGATTFPLMAVLIVPILLGLPRLYDWAGPEAGAGAVFGRFRHLYLNTSSFLLRTALYFGAWIALAYFLNKWSEEQDRTGEPSLSARLQALSGPGLVIYGLTVTFASVDWAMSLEPGWFSTIYGMIFMASQGLVAMAFGIVVVKALAARQPLSEIVSPSHFHDLGNLLLAFVMLWAYLAFSQFLIIWSGNLQDEIPWYVSRGTGRWGWLAVFLIVFHFAVPFLLLLSRDVKRRMRVLAAVAASLIVLSWVDIYWIVMPAFDFSRSGPHVRPMDFLALLGIGGIWMAWFVSRLKARPLIPLHDPRFAGVLNHEH